ncbi:MAG: carbamoyltransferase HypF [Acidobacteria bacterium]|nr:MAG: carbamoyltransferase HypF [Acidobacteriota bacterium]
MIRIHVNIQGAVQGVGFRPFVYRLAHQHRLTGWIVNSPSGVEIEVQGKSEAVSSFVELLPQKIPPLALIKQFNHKPVPLLSGEPRFQIRPSKHSGPISAVVLPDIATCSECLQDVFDPDNRRYLYPFTNCTNCGPRYSIIEKLPYDRPYTAMKHFPMCEKCLEEYNNPLNRRFHAQPNACPLCGPQIALIDRNENTLAVKRQAVELCVQQLKAGHVVALKGIGGFQILVDATNERAVRNLRKRKNRQSKPFAMMASSMSHIEGLTPLQSIEKKWLLSPQAPIVLVEKYGTALSGIAKAVSGDTPTLGLMLPYSPLHHILMRIFDGLVVATSGNLSEEPICIENRECLEKLKDICDFFLIHDRPIIRPVDDSVMRIVQGREMLVRRARGFAPFPIETRLVEPNGLAMGAHLKSTVALSVEGLSFISQHIGDLASYSTRKCYDKTIKDLSSIYQFEPQRTVCDLHPDYHSSTVCRDKPNRLCVQHHYAHILSCMAENQLEGEVTGIAWDGTGLGTDGSVWGGEFFRCNRTSWSRIASLLPFSLPGGDQAVQEPRRTALSLIAKTYGNAFLTENTQNQSQAEFKSMGFSHEEFCMLSSMIQTGFQTPKTTSAGRLFDGVASILDLCHINGHEGQAPQAMELAARLAKNTVSFDLPVLATKNFHFLDWRSMIRKMFDQVHGSGIASIDSLAAGFHSALADGIVKIARLSDRKEVCLSGGCFQNRLLSELAIQKLEADGFKVYWHRVIPPNDGGISTGQLYCISPIPDSKSSY